MTNTALVPIIYARVLAGEVGRAHGDARAVLAGTGLDLDEASQAITGLTIAQYRRLLANAIAISGDETIVLKAAANLAPTIHGPVGIAASACPDVGAAMGVVVQYSTLRNPFCRIHQRDLGDYVAIEVEIFEELGNFLEPALDFMLSTIPITLMSATDEPLRDFYLQLKRAKPESYQVYERIIPCRIEYGQEANRFVCRKDDLRIKMLGANQEVYSEALERCNALYNLRHIPSNAIEAVNNQLMRMSGQLCNIHTVADSLGMSGRTLQRRLKALGTSYQTLLDKWLSQEAVKYLVEENLTVEVTAVLLGYADEANFRRAFKRWLGHAPGVYKRMLMESSATHH